VAASLVATWQRDQKPEVLDQILEAARPVWTGAILARNGYSADFDELPSAAKVKIWRKIAKYDSKRRISSTISIGGFIRFEPSALMSTNCGLKGGWWKGQLSAEFTLKRHERADSMSIVYGIPPADREFLHDATVLEIRRQLLPITKIPAITRGNLRGTRGFALARYADELSPENFAKLAFLLRNLSPTQSSHDLIGSTWC
jgi:hypothetical protein